MSQSELAGAAPNAPDFSPAGAAIICERQNAAAPVKFPPQYDLLLEQLNAGVFGLDAAGRYVFVNPVFCRLTHATAESVLGKTETTLPPLTLAGQLAKGHHWVMKHGRPVESEEEYADAHGKTQYWRLIRIPVLDAAGKVSGSQGILLDRTERKKNELELARVRNLLGALMDKSNDNIYFKDLESRFLCCSANMTHKFQVKDAADLVGLRDRDFFSDEHAVEAYEDEQAIIRTGQPLYGKMEKETWSDGRATWVLTTKWPYRNEAGEITGTFGISKDITAIKESEAKLQEVHEQLMVASRQAGMAEVAASVLHNVGNVLNSVNVSSSLIADTIRNSKICNVSKSVAILREHEPDLGNFLTADPKGKQLLGYLETLAQHLSQMETRILHEVGSLSGNITHIKEIVSMHQNYARISGVTETVTVVDMVEAAMRMNQDAMERHKVTVVREFADVPPVIVEKHHVLQILVNLIRNAKYACDDSGRTDKQITLRIGQTGDRIQISIIDNGVGIPAENLLRIFSHGFTTRKEGHGFGLHSGALTAKQLRGTLTASSEGHNRGATFTLEIPVK